MHIFVTADLHLGHEGIRQHCARPFSSVEEMDEALISNWNGAVSRRDLVYVVGDFAWRNHNLYLGRLNGKKILVRGNHDQMPGDALRHFTETHDLLVRRIAGHRTVLCHYCLTSWPGSNGGTWHLYGHSHGRIRETSYSPRCDVGVDVWDYAPVPWEAVEKKLAGRAKVLGSDPRALDRNVEENREENRKIRAELTG